MSVRSDLLERSKDNETVITADLRETNMILRALLAEMRKDVPKVEAEARVVNGYIFAGGVMGADFDTPALVRFYYAGNAIKSLFTVIANSSSVDVMVPINEPSVNLGTAVGNGLWVPKQSQVILPDVEIESLTIRVAAAATSPVPINRISGTNGMLSIYAWTLREYGAITE